MVATTIYEAASLGKDWLFYAAAPLWASQGVESNGMFSEKLSEDGLSIPGLEMRLRVQARQIYSFCALGRLGWDGPWRDVASKALECLLSRGFRADGFCVHLFDSNGCVKNDSIDLYDHAFLLFALAHAGVALGRKDAIERANSLRNLMIKSWRRPEGGYYEGKLVSSPPHRQNPHMHLLEAALANDAASPDPIWRDMADEIGQLFQSRFWHPGSGAVTEYFDPFWNRLAGAAGELVEPGHCFEWAWLFEVGFKHPSAIQISDSLCLFARTFGLDKKRGVCINEVYLNGDVKDEGARLWPQTERLKAAVARFKRTKKAEEAEEAVAAFNGLALYLDMETKGLWRDRLMGDGTWVDEAAPASSFYHIVCALGELIDLQNALNPASVARLPYT